MNPRRFDALRPRDRAEEPDAKVLKAAVQKIARTQEGEVLLGWLRWRATQPLRSDAPDGALREQNGERMLLATIEGLIASEAGARPEQS